MLESLTCAAFASHLHENFVLHVDGRRIDVELVEADEWPGGPAREGGRVPFSIVFRGPAAVVLPQRIYAVEHPVIGTLDLFLVTIGPDGEGMRYEAVFT